MLSIDESLENARRKFRAAQAEIEDLERQKATRDAKPEWRIADALHSVLCGGNHVDDCDWMYDQWPTQRGEYGARGVYQEKARRMIAVDASLSVDTLVELVAALRLP